jgi:hypothetical protein
MPENDKKVQLEAELNYLKWVLSIVNNPETKPILENYAKDKVNVEKKITDLEHLLKEE